MAISQEEGYCIEVQKCDCQCFGSGLFIPDPNFFHPRSRIQGLKDYRIPDPILIRNNELNPKIVSKFSET